MQSPPIDLPESPCGLLGPAPCDECPLRARCETQLLACESYCFFVRDLACWDGAKREPTRARYLTVFADKKEQQPGSSLRWLRPPPSDNPSICHRPLRAPVSL